MLTVYLIAFQPVTINAEKRYGTFLFLSSKLLSEKLLLCSERYLIHFRKCVGILGYSLVVFSYVLFGSRLITNFFPFDAFSLISLIPRTEIPTIIGPLTLC